MNLKPGTRVTVKPIVFFPTGVIPEASWKARWMNYHVAAQAKYRDLLKQRDTFGLAPLAVVSGGLSATQYRNLCFTNDGLKSRDQLASTESCSDGVEAILAEILQSSFDDGQRYTRYTLPYCLSVVLIDPARLWGAGGGRNLNGAFNLGGGVLVIPSWHWDDGKLASTLVHELGHTFGLVHVQDRSNSSDLTRRSPVSRCYYDQDTSNSIMSYNTANWSNATSGAQIPGCLLGDEIENLSRNRLVFPQLTFDPATDFSCPPGQPAGLRCPPHDKVVRSAALGPMTLVWCTTGFPAPEFGSIQSLNDTPGRWILSSHPEVKFDAQRMWHSGEATPEGWVSLEVTFPHPLTLSRAIVYTEHSGQHHRAEMVQVEWEQPAGTFEFLTRVAMADRDAEVSFEERTTRRWRFAFKTGASRRVVVRGLRFFYGDEERYPPLGPHATTDYGETFESKVSNLVEIQRRVRASSGAVGFDARSMWHSGPVNAEGWVSVDVTFPTIVTLDRVLVYSQHSGVHHAADQAQVEVANEAGSFTFVKHTAMATCDGAVHFPARTGKTWRIAFHGSPEGFIVIRGLRFMVGNEEFYPPARIES